MASPFSAGGGVVAAQPSSPFQPRDRPDNDLPTCPQAGIKRQGRGQRKRKPMAPKSTQDGAATINGGHSNSLPPSPHHQQHQHSRQSSGSSIHNGQIVDADGCLVVAPPPECYPMPAPMFFQGPPGGFMPCMTWDVTHTPTGAVMVPRALQIPPPPQHFAMHAWSAQQMQQMQRHQVQQQQYGYPLNYHQQYIRQPQHQQQQQQRNMRKKQHHQPHQFHPLAAQQHHQSFLQRGGGHHRRGSGHSRNLSSVSDFARSSDASLANVGGVAVHQLHEPRCLSAPASPPPVPRGSGAIAGDDVATLHPSVSVSNHRHHQHCDAAPDLERFLKASTPLIPHPGRSRNLAALQLSEVWKFFERSSTLGLECPVLGGPRGPSTCYFVPFLSAVQLYEPVCSSSGGGSDDGNRADGKQVDEVEGVFEYPDGLDNWPSHMRRRFSWAASEHVAERSPLFARVQEVSGDASTQHPLQASLLRDLHPYSWFAVAWYPLYRIPEAPLAARFLTFHSLASLWEVATAAHDRVSHNLSPSSSNGAAGLAHTTLARQHHHHHHHKASAAQQMASMASYKLMLAGASLSAAEGAIDGDAEHRFADQQHSIEQFVAATSHHNVAGVTMNAIVSNNSNNSTGPPSSTLTPTGIASFPGSPFTASEVAHIAGTITTSSVADGATMSYSHSAPSLAVSVNSDTASVTASFGSSLAPSEIGASDDGDGVAEDNDADCFNALLPRALHRQEENNCFLDANAYGVANPNPNSSSAKQVKPLELPAVGLCWHIAATAQGVTSSENWTDTLLALDDGVAPQLRKLQPVVWEGTAVATSEYPISKGGPLSWEIQLEELEDGARSLAMGAGLVRCGSERDDVHQSCCPDYDFFKVRQR